MQRAIRIDDALSVIVTFREHQVVRLTPQGLEEGTETTCFISDAQGYSVLGEGTTLRAQEDCPDPVRAMRQSLERAAQNAFPFPWEKDARAKLHQALEGAIADARRGQEEIIEAVASFAREVQALFPVPADPLYPASAPTVAAPNAYNQGRLLDVDPDGYGHGV